MIARRSRRPRKPKQGEADFIIRQIADRGDAIGFGPNGEVFILAALDRAWFERLCAYGAALEDMEDNDEDDDGTMDLETDGAAEEVRYVG